MQHILLTGATGGIGSAIARALERGGNQVVGVNRGDADLSSFTSIEKLEQKVAADETTFDWLVLAHGFIDSETNFENQTAENIELTFQLNTLSFIYFTKLFLKHVNAGGGVILIASTAGLHGNGAYPVYGASKAAINAFVQGMARGQGAHSFYSICPGPTETRMWQKIGGEPHAAQDPNEVAKVVADIVGGKTEYKSGDIIVIRNNQTKIEQRLL